MFFRESKTEKKRRFNEPDFQNKLRAARSYRRAPEEYDDSAPRRFFTWSQKISLFFLFVLFILYLYFFVFTDRLLISNVKVLSDNVPDPVLRSAMEKIHGQKRAYVPGNNFFFLNKLQFFQALQTEYPEAGSINLFKKTFPDTLEIRIEMRKPAYVWRSGDSFYYLDTTGTIYQQIITYDPSIYTEKVVTDKTAAPVTVGQRLDMEEKVRFLQNLEESWDSQVVAVKPAAFSISGVQSPDILTATDIGFEIYFDSRRSAEAQVKNLNLLLSHEINPQTLTGLSYIDLRLSEIAYYCYKDAPCSREYQAANATSTKELINEP